MVILIVRIPKPKSTVVIFYSPYFKKNLQDKTIENVRAFVEGYISQGRYGLGPLIIA